VCFWFYCMCLYIVGHLFCAQYSVGPMYATRKELLLEEFFLVK
jgi:hypothetical protein